MTEPVSIGIVGAGPWAGMVHAPVFAAGLETRLAGVWARRIEAAEELTAKHGGRAFERYEDLLEACDAVVFSVPPDVQPGLAVQAAKAGKALLLEKPIAGDVAGAEQLAEAVAAAGVPTMVMLSYRFSAHVQAFIAEARTSGAVAGRGTFLGGGFLPGSPFGFGWRLERGAMLDLGPHLIDLMEAALGPVVSLHASGDTMKVVNLLLDHESGATSTVALSGTLPFNPARVVVELYGPKGDMKLDALSGGSFGATMRAAREQFAAIVRAGVPHEHDVRRGLHLQRLIAEAESQLSG